VARKADLDISEDIICQESNRDSSVGQPTAQSLYRLKYRRSPNAVTRKTNSLFFVLFSAVHQKFLEGREQY
jgi:hypothetical protein